MTIAELTMKLRAAAAERDWDQFHSPKNLAAALSVEAAELLEQFQWLTEEQSRTITDSRRLEAIREEIGDVLLYLTRLSDKLGIDLVAAGHHKHALSMKKYPVEKSRGLAKKYNEL